MNTTFFIIIFSFSTTSIYCSLIEGWEREKNAPSMTFVRRAMNARRFMGPISKPRRESQWLHSSWTLVHDDESGEFREKSDRLSSSPVLDALLFLFHRFRVLNHTLLHWLRLNPEVKWQKQRAVNAWALLAQRLQINQIIQHFKSDFEHIKSSDFGIKWQQVKPIPIEKRWQFSDLFPTLSMCRIKISNSTIVDSHFSFYLQKLLLCVWEAKEFRKIDSIKYKIIP